MKIRYAFLSVFDLIAMAGSSQASGYTFTEVKFPGAQETVVNGVSGSTVIGYYINYDESDTHGFIYDGATFKTVDVPDWSALPSPTITGISGGTMVGFYQPGPGIVFKGFVYDGSALTTLDFPGVSITEFLGVSGNTVFGTTYIYGTGFVAQLQVPGLQISLTTSNSLVISWPYPSTGWNLQQNGDLASTNWVTPSKTIANDGTNNFIIVDTRSGNLFFRLKH